MKINCVGIKKLIPQSPDFNIDGERTIIPVNFQNTEISLANYWAHPIAIGLLSIRIRTGMGDPATGNFV